MRARTVSVFLLAALILTASGAQADFCVPGWSSGTAASTTFYRACSAYWDGKIYVTGGGIDSSGVFNKALLIYDVAADSWSTGTDFDAAGYQNSCMVAWDGKLYVIGGYDGAYLTNNKIYDIAGDAWSNGAAMPTGVSGPYCAAIDGKIYVAGGNPGPAATALVYDIAGDAWDDAGVADLPAGRVYGLSATDGAMFYAFTGAALDTVALEYNPVGDAWNTLASLTTGRMSPGGAYGLGKIYMVGGGGNGGDVWTAFTTAEVYDVVGDSWDSFTAPPTSTVAPASAFSPDYGGELFVIGGTSASVYYDLNQVYAFCSGQPASMDPNTGDNGADVAVTIHGAGFEAGDSNLSLTDQVKTVVPLTNVAAVDSATITATAPAGIPVGVYNLQFVAASGEVYTLMGAYEATSDDDDDDNDDNDTTDDDDDDDDDDDNDSADDDDDAVDDDDDDNDDDDNDAAGDDDSGDDDDDNDSGCGC